MDGAEDKITWLLEMTDKYDLKVMLDMHGLKGSQNGFDNSGIANQTRWSSEDKFDHWTYAAGEWMGQWNFDTKSYDFLTYDNANFDIEAIKFFTETWQSHPSLYAIECINEPWGNSNIDFLKWYYREAREAMRSVNPDIKFVFYAADGITDTWLDLFPDDDMDNVVMDWHNYTAWWGT